MSRLIDADLLGLTDMEIIMCDGDYKEALKMLIDKIEHAPTIEPQQTCEYWDSESKFCALCRPSAQSQRLTNDDFETIRIHLNAHKEKLCNQKRWKEAEEYQRIIDRFMAFASAQPERKKGKWIHIRTEADGNALYECSECHMGEVHVPIVEVRYCWNCGAKMEAET